MPAKYPRFVMPDSEPFDPVKLARETEKIVCKGDKRKYTDFYATGVYGGIATGYACGCCLRCIFCWVDWSRDFPEKYGEFYSPKEVFEKLADAAHRYGTSKLRISGAEPTLGKGHLLALLKYVEDSEFRLFILETNGILFGIDEDYVKRISKFTKPHVRISLKAGTPEDFTRKTGAVPESFDVPFQAIRNLLECGVGFHVAAMSADPRVMSSEERASLARKLAEIDPSLVTNIEEEVVDPYQTTLKRLEYAGHQLEWPLKEIYRPMKYLLESKK
ncbi:MAG: radical SAM protein [Methanocellales archaeon]|nr:radical SAM protein [Methanocellales archaeon]